VCDGDGGDTEKWTCDALAAIVEGSGEIDYLPWAS
jgi:hypothetical protein